MMYFVKKTKQNNQLYLFNFYINFINGLIQPNLTNQNEHCDLHWDESKGGHGGDPPPIRLYQTFSQ